MKRSMKELLDSFYDDTIELTPTVPISSETVIERTKQKIEEDKMNAAKHKKKLGTIFLAAALIAALSVSVFAAHHLLSAREVARRADDLQLAEYFSAQDIKFDFQPQTSGDYTFWLLGIAAGENLSRFAQVDQEKSYIVGAIARTDKVALTEPPDIMVTPLVSGYEPRKVNAFTLGGGRQDFLYEGVDYFIFECDNLEVFADHTVYIAAYEGLAPGADLFAMEADGAIRFQEDYQGVRALFTVPLDKAKADPAAAEKLLEETGFFQEEPEAAAEEFTVTTTETEEEKHMEIRER